MTSDIKIILNLPTKTFLYPNIQTTLFLNHLQVKYLTWSYADHKLKWIPNTKNMYFPSYVNLKMIGLKRSSRKA